MECKGVYEWSRISDEFCINRNILECKVDFDIGDTNDVEVLIETYWNVKKPEIPGGGDNPGINRNILECKDTWLLLCRFCSCVLIETYWNVKQGVQTGIVAFAGY